MSRIRVPLAVDAQLRIPLGPVQAPVRAVVLGLVALGPAALALELPLTVGKRVAVLVLIFAATSAAAAPVREGVWLGTYWALRVAARLLPSHVEHGVWRWGPVRVTDEAVITVPRSQVRGVAAAIVRRFIGDVRAVEAADGVFRSTPGGWRAVVRVEGPTTGMASTEYARWCDTFTAWLALLECPAQVVTEIRHIDRADAERAFEETCRFPWPGGPLAQEMRQFAGAMASQSVAFAHHVVLAPGLASLDGKPLRTVSGPSVRRPEAERLLAHALKTAEACGLSVVAAGEGEVTQLISTGVAGATDAAITADGAWVGGNFMATIVVTRMAPDVDYGVVVEALQRARVRAQVSLHVLPSSRESVRKYLERRRAWLRYAMREGRSDVDAEVALRDIEALQADLAAGRAIAARVALTIAVQGRTHGAMREAAAQVHAALTGAGFVVEHVTVPGVSVALASCPGCAPLRRSLLLTTDTTIARILPALGTPLADYRHPVLGINRRTGASAYLSLWSQNNFNAAIIGGSGSGRSVTAKDLLAGHVMQGANACVIDPDSEYGSLIELLGGRYYELASSSINPLGLGRSENCDLAAGRIVPVLSVMGGDEVEYRGGRPVRRLPNEDKAWLHRELAAFLGEWRQRHAEEPVLSSFVEYLATVSAARRALGDTAQARCHQVALRLETFTQGSLAPVFDRPSSLHLPPRTPVGIGFRSLSMTYAADPTPALAVALSHLLEVVLQAREQLLVVVDEAHVLTSDPDAGQVLEQLVRRARKCGAGVVLASQRIDEFLATDLGRTLASTAATKIVLGHEEMVADRVRAVFDLAEDEAAALTPPVRGRAVVIAGHERTVVDVVPCPVLWPFIRTDAPAVGARTVAA